MKHHAVAITKHSSEAYTEKRHLQALKHNFPCHSVQGNSPIKTIYLSSPLHRMAFLPEE